MKTLTKHSNILSHKFKFKFNLWPPIKVKSANVNINNTDNNTNNNNATSMNVYSRPNTKWEVFYILQSYTYFANKKNEVQRVTRLVQNGIKV